MSVGNLKDNGNKGKNLPYQLAVLQLLDQIEKGISVIPGVDYETRTTMYQAIANGAGYSISDIIVRYDIIDVATSTVLSTLWFNQTTQATIAAPVPANITTIPGISSMTVINGVGGAAVNIQDGGNSITVDATAFDVLLSTRNSEATQLLIQALLSTIDGDTSNLDVLLSTRASEVTLLSRLSKIDFEARINTLGQKTMALSTPVVIASDQSVVNVSEVTASNMIGIIQTTGFYQGKIAYVFDIVGQRSGFTSTTANNDIKEYDNAVALMPIYSNATLDIISDNVNDTAAGTGVRTVKVTYINNTNNLVESAAIALNGTTLVTSVLTGVNQVLWMETSTAGSGGVAAGNIRLRINGGVIEVEQISASTNKSKSAMFMVPTGYTGYIVNWRTSAINSDQSAVLVGQVNTLDRSLSTVYHSMSTMYAALNTSPPPMTELMLKIPALAKVKVNTISGGTAPTVKCNTNVLIAIIEN